jgi:hypothetical protein
MSNARAETPSSRLEIGLWVAQGFLALVFVGTGIWKLVTPVPDLAAMIPWAGQVSAGLLYSTAVFDILGGLGVVLPSVTRHQAKPGRPRCARLRGPASVRHHLPRFARRGGEHTVQLLPRGARALRRMGASPEGTDLGALVK